MSNGKIIKETELVRLDACVMSRVRAHKAWSSVTLAGFIENCIQKELNVLYPDGFIPEKK